MILNFNLEDIVAQAITKNLELAKNNYQPAEHQFRISTIAYCTRRIYFDKVNPEKQEIDIYSKGKMVAGNVLHEFLETYLSNNFPSEELLIETEISYKHKDIELIGHPDIVANNKVIDIKTCSEKSFNYRLNDDRPAFHHFYQVNCYACILKKDIASILYLNKEDLYPIERSLPIEEHYFLNALEKAQAIYQHLKQKTIPGPDYEEDWECRYCPYKNHCNDLEEDQNQ